jgi:hypothetical protein
MNTFDEHIQYLRSQIATKEDYIAEEQQEIFELKKEIEEVEKERDFFKPENAKPSIYLDGWKDTEKKKKEVEEWCLGHELRYHKEIFGNYVKDGKIHMEKHYPNYDFITASSDTSKIRYVVCDTCRNKFKNKKSDAWKKYLED